MPAPLKVWLEDRVSASGEVYQVRMLLADAEVRHLQMVGVLGPVWRVVDMQEAADATMALFEKGAHTSAGGATH